MLFPLLLASVFASSGNPEPLLDGAWRGHLDFQYRTSTFSPDQCKFPRDIQFVFVRGYLMVKGEKQILSRLPDGGRSFEMDQASPKNSPNRRVVSQYLMTQLGNLLAVDIQHSYYIVMPNGEKRVYGRCGFGGDFTQTADGVKE